MLERRCGYLAAYLSTVGVQYKSSGLRWKGKIQRNFAVNLRSMIMGTTKSESGEKIGVPCIYREGSSDITTASSHLQFE